MKATVLSGVLALLTATSVSEKRRLAWAA